MHATDAHAQRAQTPRAPLRRSFFPQADLRANRIPPRFFPARERTRATPQAPLRAVRFSRARQCEVSLLAQNPACREPHRAPLSAAPIPRRERSRARKHPPTFAKTRCVRARLRYRRPPRRRQNPHARNRNRKETHRRSREREKTMRVPRAGTLRRKARPTRQALRNNVPAKRRQTPRAVSAEENRRRCLLSTRPPRHNRPTQAAHRKASATTVPARRWKDFFRRAHHAQFPPQAMASPKKAPFPPYPSAARERPHPMQNLRKKSVRQPPHLGLCVKKLTSLRRFCLKHRAQTN